MQMTRKASECDFDDVIQDKKRVNLDTSYSRVYDVEFTKLEENGFTVLPSVLTSDECSVIRDKIWSWLENVGTGIQRDKPETWKSASWPINLHGILQYSIGHEQFAWDVRQHPAVHDAFKKLWVHFGVEEKRASDLLVSFDGVCIMPAPELAGWGMKQKPWPHTDQGVDAKPYSSKSRGVSCIQGVVNLADVNENDATLIVYPGSHNYHAELLKTRHTGDKSGWVRLGDGDDAWLAERGCRPTRVTGKAGDMFLWDSRTIHCNTPPRLPRDEPHSRMVVYACMMPRSGCPVGTLEKTLLKRRALFESKRMTPHLPYPTGTFPKTPRTYNNPKAVVPTPPSELPVLTPLGRRLVGY